VTRTCTAVLHVRVLGSEPAGALEFQERAYEHGASPLNYLAPYVRELYKVERDRPTREEQMRLIV